MTNILWGLIVAIMIFSTGSGISIYEGITSLTRSDELQDVGWNYLVLGFSFVAEGIAWLIALRKLRRRQKPGESFWYSLRASKDPSIFIGFSEDSASLTGLVVAFLGILWGNSYILAIRM